ncbi:MAG TPA: DinB family protein [Acidimicrobiales bacterium]|jgi:hypothetical protein|nr:DinB family protein [Acidimicrobiales bacterium]
MTTSFAAERIPRLRADARRVHDLAPRFAGHLTPPDARTQERWDQGQVLSHLNELFPFWVDQVDQVVAAGGGVAFGRTKETPSRLERIEQGRGGDPDVLLRGMDAGVDQTVSLLERLTDDQLALVGHHPSLGELTMAQAIDEFLVDHLHQHADQLADGLGGTA